NKVYVWSRTRETMDKFIKFITEQYPKINFTDSKTIEEVVKNSDVVTTLTPSKQPIVMEEWIKQGTHINAIGADAPGKQELDPKILKKAKIIVDDLEHNSFSGEINIALTKGLISKKEIYGEIGEIILGKKPGRVSQNEVTVFTSTGIAIQDIAVAEITYKKALKQGFGIKINLTGPTLKLIYS
ncbi:MAG: ornithine cyclodeaminase family protein, partial [Candidatus Bathyarchaeia archaeon]